MSRDLSHFGRVINGQERSVQNSFEMFVQFHELLSITINSQPGQTKHTFLADSSSRGLSNQQNSFDTNDYAFMIFPLSHSLRSFRDGDEILPTVSLKRYLHIFLPRHRMLFSCFKTKMNKTIHNLCAQMNVTGFLSISTARQ